MNGRLLKAFSCSSSGRSGRDAQAAASGRATFVRTARVTAEKWTATTGSVMRHVLSHEREPQKLSRTRVYSIMYDDGDHNGRNGRE
jgi:hypothetical protein